MFPNMINSSCMVSDLSEFTFQDLNELKFQIMQNNFSTSKSNFDEEIHSIVRQLDQ